MLRGRRFTQRLLPVMALVLVISPVLSCGMVDTVIDGVSGVLPGGEAEGTSERGPDRPTGTLAVGPSIVATSQVMEPGGGVLTVVKAGDPLDGMIIQVPPGAHPSPSQYNVSSATVLQHTFGPHFQPVTPLIAIENGGGYAEELIEVRIPVDVPPDHFAMAFYYDETNGTLEGIPSVDQDAHSVTIVTRHFSQLLVSIVKNTVLDDLVKKGIDSGFRPGGDDWQFVNRGSYIASAGHCAGQSLTALWYYCERPDGADPFLWNLYDNNGAKPATPGFWEDDSLGYRLASRVQVELGDSWMSFANQFMGGLAGANDEATFRAFAYAMLLTGEPQLVYIYATAGGGHAMIIYRVDAKGLHIADPNYPGNLERRIAYANGQFAPYNSGANADEIAAGHGKAYDLIGYVAKTATVDWNRIAHYWRGLKSRTIGYDRFPDYAVVVVADDGSETPLIDGFESNEENILIRVTGSIPIGTRVFRDGVRLQADAAGKYPLEAGNNVIGISIWGDVNNNPQSRLYKYIDFQYFNIWYGPKETTGCKGWALESVTPNWAPKEKKWGDQYETNYLFSATDGAFSASGRLWIGEETDQGAGALEAWVLFSHEGTWTPLPPCIPFGETTTITLNLHSPVVGIDGTPAHDRGWAASYAHLWVNINDWEGLYLEDSDTLRAASSTWEGATESMVFEFNLTELAYGQPKEGEVIEVAVWFGALNGDGCYRYKYVYHQ